MAIHSVTQIMTQQTIKSREHIYLDLPKGFGCCVQWMGLKLVYQWIYVSEFNKGG